MQNFSFNHVAISVEDVDTSVAFYQKVLGLKEIKNTASASKMRWLSLGGHHQLHVIPRPGAKITTNKAVHFALSTTDIKAFIAHLEELNIPYSDWKDTPDKGYVRRDGIIQVYFQDPDRYWVEVNNDCS
ncbi:VOC family protein [Formosa sediminum]|uniref:VOC family protein n=1 Tax=Formosa sediminum TaxID=2594004 RepID=A0A516GTM6_9FLAO|nr:VOC family protein [Formosa sediminum]QDO94852.1 VOC family protein [Formosa sediminum]